MLFSHISLEMSGSSFFWVKTQGSIYNGVFILFCILGPHTRMGSLKQTLYVIITTRATS